MTPDETDRAILRALSEDATLSSAALGERVGLSQPVAWRRVRRLEEAGILSGRRLDLDLEALGDAVKWEESRGSALFPHLYREMRLSDVAWAQPLPLVDGVHQFPAGLE